MSTSQPRLLLLEDDPDHVELFRSNLEETVFRRAQVSVTDSFDDGVAQALCGDLDLVFLDLNLRDSAQQQTIERLGLLTQHLPVVIMTSLDHGPTMLEFISLGAEDCVPKIELQPALLERVIRFALDRFRQRALTDAILQAVPEAMVYTDASGRVLRCNSSFENLSGRGSEQMVGRLIRDAWPGPLADAIQRGAQDGHLGFETTEYEIRLKAADGSDREGVMHQRGVQGTGDQTSGMVATFVDLTESRRMAQDLLHQERRRAETLTALAGGIAHDFNNRLMVILGHAEFIREAAPPGSTLRDSLCEIESAAQGSADVVRQLLAFSGTGSQVPEPIDLIEVVRATLSAIQPRVGAGIHITLRPRQASTVIGDGGQLALLIRGVILNALEAIAEGRGEIKIDADVETVAGGALAQAAGRARLRPGEYARLDIRDTGPGMPPEVLERAFEPFYSTKQVGGRGLGLSAAQGVARASGGDMWLQTQPGVGTVCSIYLPRAPDSL